MIKTIWIKCGNLCEFNFDSGDSRKVVPIIVKFSNKIPYSYKMFIFFINHKLQVWSQGGCLRQYLIKYRSINVYLITTFPEFN